MEIDYRSLEKEKLISIIWYLEGYIKSSGDMDYEYTKSRIREVFFNGEV